MDFEALQPGSIFTSEGMKWAYVGFRSYGGGQFDAYMHELGDYQITLSNVSEKMLIYLELPDLFSRRYGEPPAHWRSADYLTKVKKLSNSWNYHRVIITYLDETGFCCEFHDESRRVLKEGAIPRAESQMREAEIYTETELEYFVEISKKLYQQDTVDTIPFDWLGRIDDFHLKPQHRKYPTSAI